MAKGSMAPLLLLGGVAALVLLGKKKDEEGAGESGEGDQPDLTEEETAAGASAMRAFMKNRKVHGIANNSAGDVLYWAVYKFGPKKYKWMLKMPGHDGNWNDDEYEYPIHAIAAITKFVKSIGYTMGTSVKGDVSIPGF